MGKKKCCMLNCSSNESDVCLFGFPKDFNLCMLWVQNTGKPEFFEDFAFGGALPFLTRSICSEHFSCVDFVDIRNKAKGLLPGAVPLANYVELNDVRIKDETEDPHILDPDVEIKQEPSHDESNEACNFVFDNFSDNTGIESTKEEQQLSDNFFDKYRNAQKQGSDNIQSASKKLKRSRETNEKKKERNMKNALRAAIRRQNETPEQRERRRMNDLLRARRRRSAETEQETRIRRYNDAVRAALRRQNETEEQKAERRMYDSRRAAFRRTQESPEQRALRLKKDRERASRTRLLKRIFQQVHMLETMHSMTTINEDSTGPADMMGAPSLNIDTISSVARDCNESTTINRLQEVWSLLKQTTKEAVDMDHKQPKEDAMVTDQDPLEHPLVLCELKEDCEYGTVTNNPAVSMTTEDNTAKFEFNKDRERQYCSVNISDIPKEIRDQCIGSWENGMVEKKAA